MSSGAPNQPKPIIIQPTSVTRDLSAGNAPATSGSAASATFPQIIPEPAQTGRNLVLCFDGTGDQYDKDNSNIVRFVQLLKKDDLSKQMVYYQAGIGTGIGPKSTSGLRMKISQIIDSAIATDLGVHVRAGYMFLMQNYTEGDRISLFGFSRGAYTARALAGMLHKVGLLPAYNHEQVSFAYKMFRRDNAEGWNMSNGFKRAFCRDVKIDFVGVFDTVNSVGLVPRELPFARSNYLIRVFRHAVALDEHRAKFKANLWGRSTESEEELAEAGKHKVYYHAIDGLWHHLAGNEHVEHAAKDRQHQNHGGNDWTSVGDRGHQTDVKEVWFAGAHCDVGGGSVPNDTPNDLARIPLRWMVRECFLNNTGILFHSAELKEVGFSPASLWPVVQIPTPPGVEPAKSGHDVEPTGATLVDGSPRSSKMKATDPKSAPKPLVPDTPVELGAGEDAKDAVMPIYDQLSIAKWWWILEIIPMRYKYQRHDHTWKSTVSANLGGPRVIHGQKRFPTYVHRSVQYRMQKTGYRPRAEILESPGPEWVD